MLINKENIEDNQHVFSCSYCFDEIMLKAQPFCPNHDGFQSIIFLFLIYACYLC